MSIYQTTDYRYPFEQLILTVTLLAVFAVIAISATVTLSVALIFVLIIIAFSYFSNRAHHETIIRHAYPINSRSSPDLVKLARTCLARIQPGPVQIYVAPNHQLNAYTFGLSNPKVIVLYSSLFELMDRDELMFILGHEMGHVSLGHTRLNSLLGGMAGIPAPFGASVLMNALFLWWNRACEYSADRAGALACNNPSKAISALVKLAIGKPVLTQNGLAQALRLIETQDDSVFSNLEEALSTHPLIVRRVHALRRYTSSRQYKHLQARVNQNPV